MKHIRKGFTLIELLVVIAIIALLSTLAVVSLNNARAKSRDAKRVSDIKQMQTALELYFADQQGYPGVSTTAGMKGSTDCLGPSSAGFTAAVAGACSTPTYMGQVPSNPTPVEGTDANYLYSTAGSTNGNGTVSSYTIVFGLENTTGTLGSGAHTATPSGIQ
jgi:prepilin-type N-terminal cleavage/methylation domain-containing protein